VSETYSVTCPVDGSIIDAENLVDSFDFPEDEDCVVDALTQRLNARRCSLHGEDIQILIPLFAFNVLTEDGIFVAASIPADQCLP
jgi:hypothetical protein